MENTLKNTIYLKQDYISILLDSAALLNEGGDAENIQSSIFLNGIFSNSIAGLIRSGCLHERKDAGDGYPAIAINIDGQDFTCREQALKDIFQEDYPELINPYQDFYESYISEYIANVPTSICMNNDPDEENSSAFSGMVSAAGNIMSHAIERNKERKEREGEIPEYDPEYDHYFDEELPKVLEKLEYADKESIVYLICVIASIIGLASSLIFLL